jgi:hypothetical protein
MELKKGLARLNSTQLAEKSRTIEQRLAGNLAFPEPTPKLADVTAARETLEAAIVNAVDGGRTARAIRNARQKELKLLLDQLAGYITSHAEGNALAILSSGFELRRRGTPQQEPAIPANVQAEMSAHPGQAELRWAPVKGALTYHVEVNRTAPDNATAWELLDAVSRCRFTAKGLPSIQVSWFRVRAIGTSGKSPWSEVAQTLVS